MLLLHSVPGYTVSTSYRSFRYRVPQTRRLQVGFWTVRRSETPRLRRRGHTGDCCVGLSTLWWSKDFSWTDEKHQDATSFRARHPTADESLPDITWDDTEAPPLVSSQRLSKGRLLHDVQAKFLKYYHFQYSSVLSECRVTQPFIHQWISRSKLSISRVFCHLGR